ncbi:MAG: RNA 2',3'-cyclic phosphodiesterase [Gammaproteobacteria bacterium]|nr:RNA 2',3'-cyclic phosphodiesterase [Gammaproteobacteria bacterium]
MNEKKIFFALLPDEFTKSELVKQIAHIRSFSSHTLLKWVPDENLHLTLHFIGQADSSKTQCLFLQAANVNLEPFEFELNCTGLFRKPGAFWIGTNTISQNLLSLQRQITATIPNCGITPKIETFIPHVTIARKFKNNYKDFTIKPVKWPVKDFYLMESVTTKTGVRYEPLEKFEKLATS